ncbi:MAG: M23 family metallopeptidase [Anaerolineales bacterium]|jgi:murein DD-endopeptidase MepM/ murein hydrolase activator NlpD
MELDDNQQSLLDSSQEQQASGTVEPQEQQEPQVTPPERQDETTNPLIKTAVNIVMVLALAFLGFLLWQRVVATSGGPAARAQSVGELSAENANANQTSLSPSAGKKTNAAVDLAPLTTPSSFIDAGIARKIEVQTIIPTRPRSDVITYTVHQGDNLFTIADAFGLKPETLLWGNFDVLKDNPHLLQPDQVLNILPVDGTYYQWQEGDNLDQVVASFKADEQEVLSFPGNDIDLTQATSQTYGLEPGQWLVIPGGERELKDWGPPAISRANPASASYYGPGHCGAIYEGAFGTGSFIWPTTERFLSGYHYSAIHHAIDIAGSLGNAVFASDSGVVVYAGWSNYGYGNLIVIDHGNGWQTAYAHLSSLNVGCGQSVGQGQVIAGLGSTGNSTGPHLHFEMVYQGTKPNPMDYLH